MSISVIFHRLFIGCLLSGYPLLSSQNLEETTLIQPRKATLAEQQYWIKNMIHDHHYSLDEASQVTGLSKQAIQDYLDDEKPPLPLTVDENGKLKIRPYPGGRHPRIGFLDGAVNPQRDTKFSVFLPWSSSDYVVVDLPEAIWSNLGLTYLAHTHIPTIWDEQTIELEKLEWDRSTPHILKADRTLPNEVRFKATAEAGTNTIKMTLTLHNGTGQPLTKLRVQNCVMLKSATEFNAQTGSNKLIKGDFSAVSNAEKNRWIITCWRPTHRPWQNPPVPCIHSDPIFPDCEPGQSVSVRGLLAFYSGTDIDAAISEIDAADWWQQN